MSDPVASPSRPWRLTTHATVVKVIEHFRTIMGRRDPTDPQKYLQEHISLGWFIHLDFAGDGTIIAFGVGDKPENVERGDTFQIVLEKVEKQP